MSEAQVLNKLVQAGYGVSQPFDDNQRYDFIVDADGDLYRVQVKTARSGSSNETIRFDCSNSVANTSEVSHKEYTSEQIDSFIVYSPDLDKFYWVNVEETPSRDMTLRYKDPKGGNAKGINRCSDYALDENGPLAKSGKAPDS